MATARIAYTVAHLALCNTEADRERAARGDTDLQLHAALDHLADITRDVKRILAAREIDRTPATPVTPDGPEIGDYTHFASEPF